MSNLLHCHLYQSRLLTHAQSEIKTGWEPVKMSGVHKAESGKRNNRKTEGRIKNTRRPNLTVRPKIQLV